MTAAEDAYWSTALCTLGFIIGALLMNKFSRLWGSVVHAFTTQEEVKMVLVVRKDLKMGTGKIAAQCAHAAVATVEKLIEQNHPVLGQWRASGYPKVVVQCPDEPALMGLAAKAKAAQLPYYIIRDAGRTQIAAGSKTVLAVGPGPKSLVDSVTGELKLL